ncbi:MAG: hypothetical protein R3C32_08055 [Chloroflexota bacterium]
MRASVTARGMGVELQDIGTGLIGFPALANGRPVGCAGVSARPRRSAGGMSSMRASVAASPSRS